MIWAVAGTVIEVEKVLFSYNEGQSLCLGVARKQRNLEDGGTYITKDRKHGIAVWMVLIRVLQL